MSAGRKFLQPSARELFPILRKRLLDSRPLLVPAKRVTHRPARGKVTPRRGYNVQLIPAQYGRPTFRNYINEKGEHV